MKIEILNYIKDESNARVGFVDFKVIHSNDRWEIFRNVAHCVKDTKTWINIGKCKRDDKWVDRYERNPSLKDILIEALKELKAYLN